MSSFRIPITHFTEQDFLEAFRTDLANASQQAVILSPFLSKNRAFCYYPVLRLLALKKATIDIYTKPKLEQPQSLRNHFEEVANNLKTMGIGFNVRSGMHEKIGILDNKILWHGSLNILSHNDTRESMLRFDSPELVQEILADLSLLSVGGDPDLAVKEVKTDILKCPECGQAMLPFENAGMWICANSPTCSGTVLFAAPSAEAQPDSDRPISQIIGLECPLCKATMEVTQGVFTRIECSSPNCGFTLDPRLSAGLLKVIRRRSKA